jgi:hypothetical protein
MLYVTTRKESEMTPATKNAHDWHCEDHDTFGWRGEACRQCPEAPSEITTLRTRIAELEASPTTPPTVKRN